MVWYFYQSQNKLQKKKGKIKQKIKGKTYLALRAKPAQPAHPAHQGQGRLLPRPAHPSCSVECHRASQGRHVVAEELPGLPEPPSRTWTRPGARLLHSPPPELPPPPPVLVSF